MSSILFKIKKMNGISFFLFILFIIFTFVCIMSQCVKIIHSAIALNSSLHKNNPIFQSSQKFDNLENAQEGKKIFEANCSSCHGVNASGNYIGPSLINKGSASVDFQVGTGRMPMQMQGPQAPSKPKQFNNVQIKNLSLYIDSLGNGPKMIEESSDLLNPLLGDPIRGGEIFRTNCSMCHSASGAGGALTKGKFAPALSGVPEKYIYEAMLTGPQNMPVFNDKNIIPEDKRNIISFLKFIEKEKTPGGIALGQIGPVAEGFFLWTGIISAILFSTIWLTKKI